MQRYSVSELARGKDRGHPTETVCILADVRTNNSERKSIQVWSYGRNKIANLPRSLIRNHTHEAQHWAAISMPRWLVNKELLWDEPHPAEGEDAAANSERRTAEYVVGRENKYVLRPGQRRSIAAYGGRA
ncbi:hypothetical protein LPB73_07365 [Tardiphaga sp. 37S4]|uniref:hypothetical protein n=1 Tax=Tardiphaga sp. 37S4 TaxID=1404741 RepID=UPI001E2AB0F1|nr:hypothetical protein [Tardiphaga sp. 37S4]UFS77187.1 hypothetical protein LPB73_07365 [Tardiphaga sp. 37S4]